MKTPKKSLDGHTTPFAEKVYQSVKKIPKGKISTYKKIANAIGNPKASRAVGNVLKKNPCLIKIPCHRVICSNGFVGKYASGINKKISLLKKEGVSITNKKTCKNFKK